MVRAREGRLREKKCRRVRATAELRGSARSVKTGADIMMVVYKSDWVDEV